jgi:tetratricopeptide (TPR) repeat protein
MTEPRRKNPVVMVVVLAGTLILASVGYVFDADRRAVAQIDAELKRAEETERRGALSVSRSMYEALIDAPVRCLLTRSAESTRIERARLELAKILDRQNETARAERLLQAIVTEPAATEAKAILSGIRGRRLLVEANALAAQGRWWDAERMYRQNLDFSRASLPHRLAFQRILIRQGRTAEAREVYSGGLFSLDKPADGLLSLWTMDTEEPQAAEWERSVEAAAAAAPADPRVRLARAFLARSSGRFDEAFAILSELTQKPADGAAEPDVPVRAAMLALATESQAHFSRGLSLVFSERFGPLTLPRAEAEWAAARLCRIFDRPQDESKRIETILAMNPSDRAALSRLAELAKIAGDQTAADRWTQAKSEAERRRIDYTLLARKAAEPTPEQARRLAEMAKDLGLPFDAWAWGRIAQRQPLKPETAPKPETANLPEIAPELSAFLIREAKPESTEATASAADRPATLRFTDVAARSGLAQFVHVNGGNASQLTPPLSSSGGVAIFDYDGDGHRDVFAVQSGAFPPDPAAPHDGDKLFRNRGDGTFEDVTKKAGIDRFPRGFGCGVAVGDVDGDGRPDLFVTRWRSYALYRNKGDGTFEDVTTAYGLGGDRDWPTSAAFADLDNDGDLDLYVCHYLEWIEGKAYPCIDPSKPNTYDCRPRDFPSLPDRLFRNDGGRFTDVSAEAGIADVDKDGRGLGVVAVDVNSDGLVDLFVANDTTPNFLLINKGGMKFEDEALTSGVAANAQGGFQAGMGVAAADVDGDGLVDLAVTNFFNESTTVFRNLGGGLFADQSAVLGVTAPSRFLLGFGIVLVDFDNDGLTDYMTANGHVTDSRPAIPWRMPLQVFQGTSSISKSGRVEFRFTDASADAGDAFRIPLLARGLACGDLDGDGLVDVVAQSQNDPLLHLKNESGTGMPADRRPHWLGLELRGMKSNRDGVGVRAVVTLRDTDGQERKLTSWRVGGGSFQSASDGRLHFGLGGGVSMNDSPAVVVESLRVEWPSGQVDEIVRPPIDRVLIVREGDGVVTDRPN